MLHKMGYEFVCSECDQPVHEDEVSDNENGICETCHDKWCREQEAYWRPRYDGEKLAGIA